jgi:hypothetical protein
MQRLSTDGRAARGVWRAALFAALTAAALLCGGAEAAEPLFGNAAAPAAESAAASRFALRSRVARVDVRTAARLSAGTREGAVEIDLLPGTTAVAELTGSDVTALGNHAWTGRLLGGAWHDFALLVVDGDEVTGQVQFRGRLYSIRPLGAGLHRIEEAAPDRFPGDIVKVPEWLPKLPRLAVRAAGRTTIDVLFAYTTVAEQSAGSARRMEAEIDLAVGLANRAYGNSGVAIKLALVGTTRLDGYPDGVSFEEMLGDVTNGKAPAMVRTRRLRDRLGADLVAVLRQESTYCGLAWLAENPSLATADSGFSVTSRECIANYAVTHELGHNMGLEHDRYVSPPAPPSKYNFGYVSLQGRFETIMAYPYLCFDRGLSCQRIAYFSASDKRYRSFPLGIRQGKKGAADAARALNENRAGVAAYRRRGASAVAVADLSK